MLADAAAARSIANRALAKANRAKDDAVAELGASGQFAKYPTLAEAYTALAAKPNGTCFECKDTAIAKIGGGTNSDGRWLICEKTGASSYEHLGGEPATPEDLDGKADAEDLAALSNAVTENAVGTAAALALKSDQADVDAIASDVTALQGDVADLQDEASAVRAGSPYYSTIQEVLDLHTADPTTYPVGYRFQSNDKDSVTTHPNKRRYYKIISTAPYWFDLDAGNLTAGDSISQLADGGGKVAMLATERASLQEASEYFILPPESGTAPTPVVLNSQGQIELGLDENGRIIAQFDGTQASFAGATKTALSDTLASQYVILPEDGDDRVIIAFDAIGQVVSGFEADDTPIPNPAASAAIVPVRTATAPLGWSVTLAADEFLIHPISGQSLGLGQTDGVVISDAQPFSNFMEDNGPAYVDTCGTSFVPLIEHAYSGGWAESPCSSSANYLSLLAYRDGHVSDPNDMAVCGLVVAVGGTSITEWVTGGTYHARMAAAVTCIYNLAQAEGSPRTPIVPYVVWIQGEQDTGMAAATYQAHLDGLQAAWEADIQAVTGQTQPVPFILYQTARQSAGTANPATAQYNLCRDEPDRFFHATPIADFPTLADATHLTAVGEVWMGHYIGRAASQVACEGVRPQWLHPLSAIASGTEIRVKFSVPYKPMVFGTHLIGLTDHGVKVVDGTGTLTISAMEIDDGDTLVITINRSLGTNPSVRFARDYNLNSGHTNAAQCDIVDSCPDTAMIEGTEYPLYHRMPHCTIPIISI